MKDFFLLLFFLAFVALVGAFGAQFQPGPWYEDLKKPSFNPPNWVFGPVWSVLYLMIAVSGWQFLRAQFGGETAPKATPPTGEHKPGVNLLLPGLAAYGAQLLLNGLWSWLFFGMHLPGVAFVEILLLAATILLTLVLFWKSSPFAAALLIPYLLWVSFAAVLNGSLWAMNLALVGAA